MCAANYRRPFALILSVIATGLLIPLVTARADVSAKNLQMSSVASSSAASLPPPSVPPAPPFKQCPAIGANTSCSILLYIDTDGSLKVVSDPSQGPYDGSDDPLVGIQNNSSKTIDKIVLKGSQAI